MAGVFFCFSLIAWLSSVRVANWRCEMGSVLSRRLPWTTAWLATIYWPPLPLERAARSAATCQQAASGCETMRWFQAYGQMIPTPQGKTSLGTLLGLQTSFQLWDKVLGSVLDIRNPERRLAYSKPAFATPCFCHTRINTNSSQHLLNLSVYYHHLRYHISHPVSRMFA